MDDNQLTIVHILRAEGEGYNHLIYHLQNVLTGSYHELSWCMRVGRFIHLNRPFICAVICGFLRAASDGCPSVMLETAKDDTLIRFATTLADLSQKDELVFCFVALEGAINLGWDDWMFEELMSHIYVAKFSASLCGFHVTSIWQVNQARDC